LPINGVDDQKSVKITNLSLPGRNHSTNQNNMMNIILFFEDPKVDPVVCIVEVPIPEFVIPFIQHLSFCHLDVPLFLDLLCRISHASESL
jgi:hypothetical protein